jgi:hypothetical protein
VLFNILLKFTSLLQIVLVAHLNKIIMKKNYLFIGGCLLFISIQSVAQEKPISYEFQTGMRFQP